MLGAGLRLSSRASKLALSSCSRERFRSCLSLEINMSFGNKLGRGLGIVGALAELGSSASKPLVVRLDGNILDRDKGRHLDRTVAALLFFRQ